MLRIFLAVVITALATAQWYQVIYLGIPMVTGAVLTTFSAAVWWLMAILRSKRDDD